ncbi:MAG: alpha/beta fold hydrolase [Nocardioides sp.]|uniref:alpha/beta fold hydrolase n=1 Tax=Nocardioides sp. TaxID=35761 RepID=UPI0039E5E756
MLAYDRAGSGEPLLLIHGIGHRRQAWAPVVDRLAEEYDVIAVDLPGHGESPAPTDPSIPVKDGIRMAFEELFEELGIGAPHVVGNSLGGLIALEMAVDGLACSVTALSPAGFWAGPRDFAYVRAVFGTVLTAARLARPVAPRLLGTRAGRAAMLGWLHTHPSRVDAELARGDYAHMLAARPAIDALFASAYAFEAPVEPVVPITVAWSSRDVVLLPYQARRARQLLPSAEHVWLHGCGHVPMPDDPELVAATIIDTARAGDYRPVGVVTPAEAGPAAASTAGRRSPTPSRPG